MHDAIWFEEQASRWGWDYVYLAHINEHGKKELKKLNEKNQFYICDVYNDIWIIVKYSNANLLNDINIIVKKYFTRMVCYN